LWYYIRRKRKEGEIQMTEKTEPSQTPPDLKSADGVKSFMAGSGSEDDWNSRCDQVKAANNGYPSFWFPTVMQTGLAAETSAKWKGTDQIKVVAIKGK
jgi:Zn-dependent M28 family amino/carboxypeptidase